jgi:hypothetical protein
MAEANHRDTENSEGRGTATAKANHRDTESTENGQGKGNDRRPSIGEPQTDSQIPAGKGGGIDVQETCRSSRCARAGLL